MCGNSLTFCILLLIASSLALQPSSTNDDNNYNNLTVRKFDENTKMCDNIIYIYIFCCPLNNCLVHKYCISEENGYLFSNVYNYLNDSMQNENKKVDEFCPLIVQNPRQLNIHFQNKSFYFPFNKFTFESTIYCLANVDDDQFNASICLKAANEIFHKEMDKIINDLNNEILSTELTILFYSNIVSMLCLFLIFLVYSILPELRNIHSFMLRRSISMLFIVYTIEVIDYLFNIKALVRYFCLLTSDFWLSVISFDMWWTFRNFWSLQRNMEQQKRKKFIYSTIAWGGPFILTIICMIMEFVPSESKNLIRPGLCIDWWFQGDEAYRLYSFGPECICISSSICLSIYTALKIMQYEKDTTRHLGYLERQSFNNNKQWINLYLKLSIVLSIIIAIRGIILIIWEFWLHRDITKLYISHIITLMTTVQHIGTFVIFVCKKTTMQLLLKHLCQNHGFISKRSRQNRSNRYELQQLRHH